MFWLNWASSAWPIDQLYKEGHYTNAAHLSVGLQSFLWQQSWKIHYESQVRKRQERARGEEKGSVGAALGKSTTIEFFFSPYFFHLANCFLPVPSALSKWVFNIVTCVWGSLIESVCLCVLLCDTHDSKQSFNNFSTVAAGFFSLLFSLSLSSSLWRGNQCLVSQNWFPFKCERWRHG